MNSFIPESGVECRLEEGRLKVIEGGDIEKLDWVIAWKRKRMGKAKSCLIRTLPKNLCLFEAEYKI